MVAALPWRGVLDVDKTQTKVCGYQKYNYDPACKPDDDKKVMMKLGD